jgi:hypothetical protein
LWLLLLQDTPLYEVLYQQSTALNQRKKEMRVRAEAEMLSTCTFAPKLTSQQLVKSGRVMQVRAVQQNLQTLWLMYAGRSTHYMYVRWRNSAPCCIVMWL